MFRMQLETLAIFVFISASTSALAIAQTQPISERAFDEAAFNKLTVPDRLAVVVAGMREHESKLENVDLTITEAWTSRYADKNVNMDRRIHFKRLGTKYWCEITASKRGRSIVSWDGQVATSFGESPGVKYTSGLVRHVESPDLQEIWHLDQLGSRREYSGMNVADWISQVSEKQGITVDVKVSLELKRPCMVVELSDAEHNRWTYVVDPSRDFIIMHKMTWINVPGHPIYKAVEALTNEAKEITGIWLPWKVTRTHRGATGETITTITMAVKSFEARAAEDKEFIVDLPPGTRVVNEVESIAYSVKADRTREMLPYYNPKTGRVLQPTTLRVLAK
jgi:hypothetical protein